MADAIAAAVSATAPLTMNAATAAPAAAAGTVAVSAPDATDAQIRFTLALPALSTIAANLNSAAPAKLAVAPASPDDAGLPELLALICAQLPGAMTAPAAGAAPASSAVPASATTSATAAAPVTAAAVQPRNRPVVATPLPLTANPITADATHAAQPAAGTDVSALPPSVLPALAASVEPPAKKLIEAGAETSVTATAPELIRLADAAQAPAPGNLDSAQGPDRWLQNSDFMAPPAVATAAANATENPMTAGVLSLPVEHPDWAASLGQQVLWSVGPDAQNAEIRLHPRELGNVDVSLHVDQGQASVTFGAAHPLAREALEQALPKLREMFAQQGMTLTQAQVFSQTAQDGARQQAQARANDSAASFAGNADAAEAAPAASAARRALQQHAGLLDDYA